MSLHIDLEREFAVPVERLFAAFTDPRVIAKWWGPGGTTTEAVEMDLRPGGACRWDMRTGAGDATVLHGRILDFEIPSLLVMFHRWDGQDAETLVTMRFTPLGATRSRLVLRHEHLPPLPGPDAFVSGWSETLRRLTDMLEGGQR